jgi:hypothetical protein
MKKVLLSVLVAVTMFSCSSDEADVLKVSSTETVGTPLVIPQRYIGSWLAISSTFSAEIKTNTVNFDTQTEKIPRSNGILVEDDKMNVYKADLGNKEQLTLLLIEGSKEISSDDILFITLTRNGVVVAYTAYNRRK